MDNERLAILEFLKWNDRNGAYTDSDRKIEGFDLLSYADAIKYFFNVINDDIYYSITDNIFELSYADVIQISKEKDVYTMTIKKLKSLVNNKPSEKFYRSLLE